MHNSKIPQKYIDRVIVRGGKKHSVESLTGSKTALVVVDMQLYFMGEDQPSECPVARDIVPNVNRLADATRRAGGTVIWIQTVSGPESLEFWSAYYQRTTPESGQARVSGMSPDGSGYDLWPDLDVQGDDLIVNKTRYSAFIDSNPDMETVLRECGIDTMLITGVSTSTCCESTARFRHDLEVIFRHAFFQHWSAGMDLDPTRWEDGKRALRGDGQRNHAGRVLRPAGVMHLAGGNHGGNAAMHGTVDPVHL